MTVITIHNWIWIQTTFTLSFQPRIQGRDRQQIDYYLVNLRSNSSNLVISLDLHFTFQFQASNLNAKQNEDNIHLCDLWDHTFKKSSNMILNLN